MNAPTELASQTYTLDEALDVARHHYRRRDLGRARRVCKAILASAPTHVPTLELVCQLALVDRQADGSLPAIEIALAERPDFAALYFLRGKLLHALGRKSDAVASLESARELGFGADALRLIADIRLEMGDEKSAVKAYDEALALEPSAPDLLSNRGSLLKRMGRLDEALSSHRAAVAASPSSPDLLNNLANTLQAMGRNEEALQVFDQILVIESGSASARRGRAVSLMRMGRPVQAAEAFAWLVHRGYRDPAILQAWSMCLRDTGRHREALQAIDHALTFMPDNPELLAQRGLLLMTVGRMAEGLPLYEHRWGSEFFAPNERDRFPALQRWTGEHSPAGHTVLLHAEQGLGDTIHFCRYARHLAEAGASVLLEVDPSLVSLIATLSPNVSVIGRGESLPEFDLHCPLMSLPWAWMRLTGQLNHFSNVQGYLRADSAKVEAWRDRLVTGASGPWVGLVWRGRASHRNSAQRDIALAKLLHSLPSGPRYVSLQRDLSDEERSLLAARGDVACVGDDLNDFSDAAAVCVLLEQLVSVDTSVAHLAAALGRPVSLLVPFSADWRWQVSGTQSEWYPSVTLCRQAAWGAWDAALAAMSSRLPVA